MTDDYCEDFIMYLSNNKILNELYLGWNLIDSKGANMIFEKLINNNHLKILDFSWNNLAGDVT
jgi:hypothetical protein